MSQRSAWATTFLLFCAGLAAWGHPPRILSLDQDGLLAWCNGHTNGMTVVETTESLMDARTWRTLCAVPVTGHLSNARIQSATATAYYRLRWVGPTGAISADSRNTAGSVASPSGTHTVLSDKDDDWIMTRLRLEVMGQGWMRFKWKPSADPILIGYRYRVTKLETREGPVLSVGPWIEIDKSPPLTVTNEPGYYYRFDFHGLYSGGDKADLFVGQ